MTTIDEFQKFVDLVDFAVKLLKSELAEFDEEFDMKKLDWDHSDGVNLYYNTNDYRLHILVRDFDDFERIRNMSIDN